jgi:hypothetical protein
VWLKSYLEPGYEVLEYIDPHAAMPVRAWLSHLLLAMGSKGSQRRDIALAYQRWNDFKSRNAATEFNE